MEKYVLFVYVVPSALLLAIQIDTVILKKKNVNY